VITARLNEHTLNTGPLLAATAESKKIEQKEKNGFGDPLYLPLAALATAVIYSRCLATLVVA
jgi:hypothetical protein